MRPGADPTHQLAEALDDALGKDETRLETLRRSSFGLIRAGRQGRSPNENLLVLVDQFEEIFRQPKESSREFVRLLLTALQEAQSDYRIYLVLTMRIDYLGDCAQFRDLPEALNDSQYLVPRLTPEQRRQAIVEPARLSGGEVDPLLLQQLLLDAGDEPDQLPILQHLLMRIWDLDDGNTGCRRLALDGYRKAGGWNDAIDRHGKELLDALTEPRRQTAKRVFQRVTELGGRERDRRRLTPLSELVEVCASLGSESDVRAVVEHFSAIGSNFLTSPDWNSDPDPLVDITHESLIRQWSLLKGWADQENLSGERYRRIEGRVREGGAYLQGQELQSALKARKEGAWSPAWARRYAKAEDGAENPFGAVDSFLDLSCKREAAERFRQERNRIVIVVVAIVFAILASMAGYFAWSARVKQHEARSRELAAYAVERLADDPELSVALGIQAVNATWRFHQSTPAVAEDTLHRALLLSPIRLTLRGHKGSTAKVWDAISGQELLTLRGHTSSVYGLAFSPDGKRLATASDDDTVQVYALDIDDLLGLARKRVTRPFTPEECRRYFPGETCPTMP
jgi:hypothetical protein